MKGSEPYTNSLNTVWVCCIVFEAFKVFATYICTDQRATKLPVLFHPYLLQLVHVYDISIPDSFMYTCYIGYVPNISR